MKKISSSSFDCNKDSVIFMEEYLWKNESSSSSFVCSETRVIFIEIYVYKKKASSFIEEYVWKKKIVHRILFSSKNSISILSWWTFRRWTFCREPFVVSLMSWTFCREPFVVNVMSWTFCPWTFCRWTFCREPFVVTPLSVMCTQLNFLGRHSVNWPSRLNSLRSITLR